MKLNFLISGSLALSSLAFVSCDGGPSEEIGQGDISKSPNLQSLSLERLEVRDTLRYTTTAGERDPNTNEFYDVIPDGADVTVDNNSEITIRDVTLTYAKIGDHEFTFTGDVPTEDALEDALQVALGSPSAVNSRLREILLQPTRTRADLIEIIQILRLQNVELGILPDEDTIVGLDTVIYSHQITSKNLNLIKGDMFGLFSSQQNFFRLKFRLASADQVANIRFLTPSHFVPFADQNDVVFIRPFQAGVFNLTLFNQPTTEVNPDDPNNNGQITATQL